MNHADDELLSRYIDGELSGLELESLQLRLSRDEDLTRRLVKLQAVDQSLKDALEQRECDPPAHITAMLQEQATVTPLPNRGIGSRRPAWPTAIAASLLTGLAFLAGYQWGGDTPTPGTLPGQTALSAALDTRLSSAASWEELDGGFKLRTVLSFKDKSGQYCREFQLSSSAQSWSGVACREQQGWNTRVLVAAPAAMETEGGYRTASASGSRLLSAYIDESMDGIPMDAIEEEALVERRWR